MELKSTRFKQAIEFALDSGKPILGTIHRNASDPLVKRIKEDPSTRLLEVTFTNRAGLAEQLEREILSEAD
jgi:nucleoside-triphosphatase THEP1